MDEIDKSTIYENLNELTTLKSLLDKNWINEELEKNTPSPLLWLIKYKEMSLQHLENNLSYLGSNEINKHKKHILGLIKGDESNLYGILTEIEVWAHLKRNNISCYYQKQVDGLNPDFLIKFDEENIVVETVAIGEEENVKSKTIREMSKKENNGRWGFVVNGVEKNSDCCRLYNLLKTKEEKFKDTFKNIIVVNTLFASSGGLWSLKNAISGYYQREDGGQQIGYLSCKNKYDKNIDFRAFFALKDANRIVNLVVGYPGSINNGCTLYFHDNPYTPFTQPEKEVIRQIFSEAKNVVNENNEMEVIK